MILETTSFINLNSEYPPHKSSLVNESITHLDQVVEKIPPDFLMLFYIILAILILILVLMVIFLFYIYFWLKRQERINYPLKDKKVVAKERVLQKSDNKESKHDKVKAASEDKPEKQKDKEKEKDGLQKAKPVSEVLRTTKMATAVTPVRITALPVTKVEGVSGSKADKDSEETKDKDKDKEPAKSKGIAKPVDKIKDKYDDKSKDTKKTDEDSKTSKDTKEKEKEKETKDSKDKDAKDKK